MDLEYGGKVKLSMNIDVGLKDRMSNKKLPIYGYRYASNNKYNNMETLISLKQEFTPYFGIEYPSPGSTYGKNNIFIGVSYIAEVRRKILEFEEIYPKAFFRNKKGDIKVYADIKAVEMLVDPFHVLKIAPDVYYYKKDPDEEDRGVRGVRVFINDEYDFCMPYRSTKAKGTEGWCSFSYIMQNIEMMTMGAIMMNTLTSGFDEYNIMEAGSLDGPNAGKFEKSITDSANEKNARIGRNKPATKKEAKASFFDKE